MKTVVLTLFCITLLVLMLQVDASPKRKSGGSKSKGGFFSSSSGSSSGGSGFKKSKKFKTLKKAAIIGVGAYGAYQLGKATAKFSHWSHGNGWGFNDYNRWRQQDGMLCRSSQDCAWMDQRLHCEDYELSFTPMSGWFGGDYLSIVGECECDNGFYWDDYEVECKPNFFAGAVGIGVIVLIVLVLLCCCGGCVAAYCFCKRR